MPIVFDKSSPDSGACCGPGSPFVPVPIEPLVLSCCPCTFPFPGPYDPTNFCNDFPIGTGEPCPPCPGIAPFVIASQAGDYGISGAPGLIKLAYGGGLPGIIFLAAPAPLITLPTDNFCFCAVMAQDVVVPNVGLDPGKAFVGVSFPAIQIRTDITSIPQATYQLLVVGSPSFNTGVPIDGTRHKFSVCVTAGVLTLAIDNGTPFVPPGIVVPAGVATPSMGITGTTGTTPFSLTVDSYCAGRALPA